MSKRLSVLLCSLVASAALCLPAQAQRVVLGSTTYDKFLAPFWAQNANASNAIAGLNANAGTNRFSDALLPLTLSGHTVSGVNTYTNATLQSWNAAGSRFESYTLDWSGAAAASTNTIVRAGVYETLKNKTLEGVRFGTNGASQSGILRANGSAVASFVSPKTGTNRIYIQVDATTATPTNYLEFIEGVLTAAQ